MDRPKYFVGIDIASETFTASIGQFEEQSGWKIVAKPTTFENEYDTFSQFRYWLETNQALPTNCIVCMEATGVYGEALAYFLVSNGFQLVIEAPLKVKRAFDPEGHKSDPVDSRQIAEYSYRFFDQLREWQPKDVAIEQIKTLLTLREQLVVQKTGHKNANSVIKRKVVRTPLAESVHQKAIKELEKHIKEIEAEIQRLIDEDPAAKELQKLLETVPGIGKTLATFLVVTMHSAPEPHNPKALAAYIGICPYEDSSGTSRHKKATSRHYGPSAMRRLIHLAAMSVRQHCPMYTHYFIRKVAEGKEKKLVINNIANKLLKMVCAIARTKTPYIPGYRSIHPQRLKQSLKTSQIPLTGS
jgi:transposase